MMTLEERRILSLISYFVANTKYCGRTKLAKLLFYCDWKHLKETGRTITGLKYLTFPFGPLPANLNSALKDPQSKFGKFIRYREGLENSTKPIVVVAPFEEKLFTPFELDIIKNTVFIFKDVTSRNMVKIFHGIDEPWTKTKKEKGELKLIDETLAFAEKDAKITLKEYSERKEETLETYRMLHGTR